MRGESLNLQPNLLLRLSLTGMQLFLLQSKHTHTHNTVITYQQVCNIPFELAPCPWPVHFAPTPPLWTGHLDPYAVDTDKKRIS